MNGLSWLIYIGSILPKLSVFLGVSAGLWIVGWATAALICAIALDGHVDDPDRMRRTRNRSLKMTAWAAVPAFLAILIPSQTTIYLIAGSQVGETVIASPDGQEIYGLVKEKLKQLLEPAK